LENKTYRKIDKLSFFGICCSISILLGYSASGVSGVFFLDMIGTAMCAFALGPWWGAATGVLTNSVLSIFLSSLYIDYMLVNITGAVIWGTLGRRYLNPIGPGCDDQYIIFGLDFSGIVKVLRIWLTGILVGVACALVALLIRVDWKLTIDMKIIESMPNQHPTEQLSIQVANDAMHSKMPITLLLVWPELFSTIPDKLLSTVVAIYILSKFFPFFYSSYLYSSNNSLGKHNNFMGEKLFLTIFTASTVAMILKSSIEKDPGIMAVSAVWSCFLISAFAIFFIAKKHSKTTYEIKHCSRVLDIDMDEFLKDTLWLIGLGYAGFATLIRQPVIETQINSLLKEGFGVAAVLASLAVILPFIGRHINPL
jgi:hypothetical protein